MVDLEYIDTTEEGGRLEQTLDDRMGANGICRNR